MDNVPGSLRAGALPPRERANSVLKKLCIEVLHALVWHIESVYPVSFEAVRLQMF